MNIGGLGALIALLMLGGLVLLIVALVDLVRRPAAVWASSGQNQLVWALIVVFIWFIGPILYLAIGRPALIGAGSGS
ncbi:MAG: PLDc N-terminal domain-containing protein [Acidimicrobiia bacterium]